VGWRKRRNTKLARPTEDSARIREEENVEMVGVGQTV